MVSRRVILVVDDEEIVRRVMIAALQTEYETILCATSGEEALTIAAEYDGPIDLVLTDLRMPGMHGLDVRQRLLEQRPGALVVVLSGDTYGGAIPDNVMKIQKPFTVHQLREQVQRLFTPRP